MTLEEEFENDVRLMLKTIREVVPQHKLPFFVKVMTTHGILKATKIVVGKTHDFRRLVKINRLDLTLEHLVLQEKYNSLFSKKERKIAKASLETAQKLFEA